jgi:drug/metabolite transporter (DMT)-like permease
MDAFDVGFVEGVESLLVNWETYVLVVAVTGGLFLQQSAYQAGNLQQALPAITILEPVVAVVIGLTILDESVQVSTVPGWAVLVVAVAAMTAGTVQLSRSTAAHEQALVETVPGYTPG